MDRSRGRAATCLRREGEDWPGRSGRGGEGVSAPADASLAADAGAFLNHVHEPWDREHITVDTAGHEPHDSLTALLHSLDQLQLTPGSAHHE